MSEDGEKFVPNEGILSTLVSMGISESDAKEALFCTGNISADDAINYIFNSKDNKSDVTNFEHLTMQSSQNVDNDDEWEDEDILHYKMTFVVNTSLKMGIGKIAAQVGHACIGLYRNMLQNKLGDQLNQWEEIGEKKIVLKGNDTAHLLELYEKAKQEKVPAYLVRDAGHTQIPSGSVTVLSLFGPEENVDKISGELTLL